MVGGISRHCDVIEACVFRITPVAVNLKPDVSICVTVSDLIRQRKSLKGLSLLVVSKPPQQLSLPINRV